MRKGKRKMATMQKTRKQQVREVMTKFETGATRSANEGKLDYRGFISPLAMKRFAEYMNRHRVQADGTIRASDNWKKGMPMDRYAESMVRHAFEFWQEYDLGRMGLVNDPFAMDEALCALVFNALGYLHEWELAEREDPINDTTSR
jgi:hypothetical protein